MTWIQLQTGSGAADAFIETAAAFGQKYWWVAVLIALAWYLRWYAYAYRRDMTGASYLGLVGAFKHAAIQIKNAGKALVLVAVGAVLGLAFIFDLIPTFLVVLGSLDPLGTAVTALMVFVGLEAFDASFVTLGNAFLVFLGTLAVLFLMHRLGDLSKRQAAEERERSFVGRIGASLRDDSAGGDDDEFAFSWED